MNSILPNNPQRHQHFMANSGQPAQNKQLPYWSDKRLERDGNGIAKPINRNGQVNIPGQTKKIVCRHFAGRLVEIVRDHPGQPLRINDLYGTDDRISSHIPSDIQQRYAKLLRHACAYHLVPCLKFGHHFSNWFREMRPNTQKVFLLNSTVHSMKFRLRVVDKGNGEKPKYVIHFFDPNRTNIEVRCAVDDPDIFCSDAYALQEFMPPKLYSLYFGKPGDALEEKECAILDCTEHAENRNTNCATFSTDAAAGVTATMWYHIMRLGLTPDPLLVQNFSTHSESVQLEVLESQSSNEGTSGLYMALQNDNPDSILVHGKLLAQSKIATSNIPRLLVAKRSDGVPGLLIALQNGRPKAIRAYGELLMQFDNGKLNKAELKELLQAAHSSGVKGLPRALEKNQTDAVQSYCEVLLDLLTNQKLDKSDINELVNITQIPKCTASSMLIAFKELLKQDRSPAELKELFSIKALHVKFRQALNDGNENEVRTLGAKLVQLSLNSKLSQPELSRFNFDELIQTETSLQHAISQNYDEAIRACGEVIVQLFAQHRLDKSHVKTLLMINQSGTPYLYTMLKNGYHQKIDSYSKLLIPVLSQVQLDQSDLEELLAAANKRHQCYAPALYEAFDKNHAEAIRAYGKPLIKLANLKLLDKTICKNLLAAKFANVVPALNRAIEKINITAIEACADIIMQLLEQPYFNKSDVQELLATQCVDPAASTVTAANPQQTNTLLVFAIQHNLPGLMKVYDKLLEEPSAKNSSDYFDPTELLAIEWSPYSSDSATYPEAIHAYMQLLQKTPERYQSALMEKLLSVNLIRNATRLQSVLAFLNHFQIKLNADFFTNQLEAIGKCSYTTDQKKVKAKEFMRHFLPYLKTNQEETLQRRIKHLTNSSLQYLKTKTAFFRNWSTSAVLADNVGTYLQILNDIQAQKKKNELADLPKKPAENPYAASPVNLLSELTGTAVFG